MTLKQVYDIKDNQLIINLPESFRGKKKVFVTVNDIIDVRLEKLEQMKKASSDPLFISDINEISNDFDPIDRDIL